MSNTRVLKHMRHHHGGDTSKMVSNYAQVSANWNYFLHIFLQFSHALHAGRDECFGNREERLRAIRMERIRAFFLANFNKNPKKFRPNQETLWNSQCRRHPGNPWGRQCQRESGKLSQGHLWSGPCHPAASQPATTVLGGILAPIIFPLHAAFHGSDFFTAARTWLHERRKIW